MPAWTLDWNSLTNDQRRALIETAEVYSCPCCGDAGGAAVNMFRAVIAVIEERDRAEIVATLGADPAQDRGLLA